MRMMRKIVVLAGMFGMLGGCATLRDSLLVGAGSGAASGAVVGAIAGSENKAGSAVLGSLVGAGLGTVAGYFLHKGLEDRDSKVRKDTLFSLEKFGVSEVPKRGSSVPSINFPIVEEQKVETHRQGNKVIEGHRIWIMSDDSNIQYDGSSGSKKK